MRQLSSLDAQFLNAETATTFTHVGGLVVLDPATAPGGVLSLTDLRAVIAGRLHLVAPLRRRLHQVPAGLDLPYWVESAELDLEYHVREVGLPDPGTDIELCEQVSRLAAIPLNREHPLWECYLIHGLSGGRQALYTKVHHAVIDGLSAAEVLGVVMDISPEPREVPPPADDYPADRAPGELEMLCRSAWRLATIPVQVVRSAPALLPHVFELPGARSMPGAGVITRLVGALSGLNKTALTGLDMATSRGVTRSPPVEPVALPAPTPPPTPFNGPITSHRRFAFTTLPLSEVKAVKNALNLTVDDVVMALCTTALRRWLIDHDALPGAPLVAAIPVSVRTRDQIGTAGNQIGFMLTALPTNEQNPGRRLAKLHTWLLAAKQRFHAAPATLLHDYAAALPQALHGLATRTLLRAARLGAPPFNLIISNVPGPQFPLYAGGATIIGNYPVSAISDVGGGIHIAVMSYNGRLDFGIIVCREMVPDVWNLARYLNEALAELTACIENVRNLSDYTPSAPCPDRP